MKITKNNSFTFIRYLLVFCVAAFSLISIIATGGGGGGSSSVGTGTLSVGLTDATTDLYQAIYVTIDEVQVHKADTEEDDWEVVATPEETFNLLELVNGVIEHLGLTDLEAGEYTQMRLILGAEPDEGENILYQQHTFANYLIDDAGIVHELKVPSGFNSGIKLVSGFVIYTGGTTELLLDFDAARSVVIAGSSGQYILKPTIKVIDLGEASTIMGTVTDEQDEPIEGVYVSAQTFDAEAADKKDEVVVNATTITDENGQYKIYIRSGIYNLVAYKDDFSPSCRNVTLESADYTEDFVLSEALTGTVSGSITPENVEAVLSFRQTAQCEGAAEDQKIEVKSLNALESYGGSTDPVMLPVAAGEDAYELVASAEEKDTQKHDIEILEGLGTIQDIDFTSVP